MGQHDEGYLRACGEPLRGFAILVGRTDDERDVLRVDLVEQLREVRGARRQARLRLEVSHLDEPGPALEIGPALVMSDDLRALERRERRGPAIDGRLPARSEVLVALLV